MSSPRTPIFHNTASGTIKNSGVTTGRHPAKNNNATAFRVSDVIGYIKIAAKPLVTFAGIDQSRGTNSRGRNAVEIARTTARDPSPSPVFSIADRYTRSMLCSMVGYPLYEPEPFSELSTEYVRKGVNIGDVGIIRADGTFDFLFNICPPTYDSINPPNLPHGFSLSERPKTRKMRPFPPDTCFFPPTITRTNSGGYTCKGSEGAVLALPEGAIQEEVINTAPFEELAKSHGVDWYKYTKTRGRSISNGSLYLVTSSTKCKQWGIAVYDRPSGPKQALKFTSSPLGWRGSGPLTTRVAYNQETDKSNQCVFLRGYKIMIRQDIFDGLLTRRSGGFMSRIKKALAWKSCGNMSDKVVLRPNFNSPPTHPLDLINAELLSQNPKAKVAITHDDVWCDLLRDNFPKLDYTTLMTKAQSYTTTTDGHGCVSLEKIPDAKIFLYDSDHKVEAGIVKRKLWRRGKLASCWRSQPILQ